MAGECQGAGRNREESGSSRLNALLAINGPEPGFVSLFYSQFEQVTN